MIVRGRWRVGRRRWRLRREGAWVSDESDSVAEGAADGSGARWKLERRAAVGAVDEHVAVHGCGGGLGWVNWYIPEEGRGKIGIRERLLFLRPEGEG